MRRLLIALGSLTVLAAASTVMLPERLRSQAGERLTWAAINSGVLHLETARDLIGTTQSNEADAETAPETHIKTWTWYGSGGGGAPGGRDVAPQIAARYFTGVFCGGGNECSEFLRAGGRYAGDYNDPTYAPYCNIETDPVRCRVAGANQIWDSNHEKTFYAKGSDGDPVRRGSRSDAQLINRIDRDDVRTAWSDFLAHDPQGPAARHFTTTFTDDVVSSRSLLYYGFSERSPSFPSDDSVAAAERAMLAAMPPGVRPVINSLNAAQTVNHALAVLTPNVLGAIWEGCITDEGNDDGFSAANDARHNVWTVRQPNPYHSWDTQLNMLLAMQAEHKLALCYSGTDMTHADNRIYYLASLWLIYDPQFTVAWANNLNGAVDDLPALPEFAIVPRAPVDSPRGDVHSLRSPGGAYVREFRRCYDRGSLFGPCAAVVNPTRGTVAFPQVRQHYTQALVITNPRSLLHGGSASFDGPVPHELDPATAVILR